MPVIGWTLSYTAPGQALAVVKTFEAWGVSGVRLRRQSQAADELSFVSVEMASAAPKFAYNGKVVIHRTAATGTVVQWYVGWADVPSVSLSGTQQRRSYKFKGPWKWLETLTFQKVWFKAINPNSAASSVIGGYRGKFVLNLDANNQTNTHQTVAQQVTEVVAYVNVCAITQAVNTSGGVPAGVITMGACPAVLPPWSDVNNITCAEAIKHQLKWLPGAVSRFDYTTAIPTLNIVLPATAITIPFSSGVVGDAGLTPRYDRQVSRVRLKYEQSNTTDGKSWVYDVWDIFPVPPPGIGTFLAPAVNGGYYYLALNGEIVSGSAPPVTGAVPPPDNQFYELMLTVNLVGWITQYARAHITSEAWNTIDWIENKLPFLKDGLSMLNSIPVLRKVVYPDGNTYVPNVSGFAPALGFEIVSGAVTDGLVKRDGTAVISQSYTAIYDVMHSKLGSVPSRTQDVQSIKFNAVNVESGYYTGLQSSTPGDPIPIGLARSLYEGLEGLQHDGSIKLKQKHAGAVDYLGNKVTLTGGNPEWANMIVQSVDESLDSGETVLSVGVAKYLSAGDLVELLRVSRNIQRFIAPHTVATGQGSAIANNSPTRMQADNSAAGSRTPMVTIAVSEVPAVGVYPPDRMEVRTDAPGGRLQMVQLGAQQTDDRGGTVQEGSEVLLRLSDCNGKRLKIREYEVCVDGITKKVLLLGSETYL